METEEQLIAKAEAWLQKKATLGSEHPEQKHTPDEYIAELSAIGAYIDRSREMHPYVRAYFYELLIDSVTSLIQVAKPPATQAEEEPHHSRKKR